MPYTRDHSSYALPGHFSALTLPAGITYFLVPVSTEVPVQLGARSYAIRIGSGLLGETEAWPSPSGGPRTALLVTDSHVGPLYADRVQNTMTAAGWRVAAAEIPAGEASKDGAHLFILYESALAAGLTRADTVVALGGGVVGDLAGFLAATYMRGIRLIQAPTSLLAMVDSSVGGKTGINLPQGKNLVGAFHQPALVLADTDTLRTLPRREYRSGLAEVVKYGIIRDAEFFRRLEAGRAGLADGQRELLEPVIARCCAIKAEVVAADERESGPRAILNFGHTLGHAIEQVTGYGRYLHGEAIAIGMVYAARLSARLGRLPEPDASRLTALLAGLGLPVRPDPLDWTEIRRAIGVDKKNAGAQPRLVLADRIGAVTPGIAVAENMLAATWTDLFA